MCTVTYIPSLRGVFLTSNRDEKKERLKAKPPSKNQTSNGQLLFPRDSDANGTWIALHERKEVLVLLNGAFEAHIPHPPYRRSRGLVVLDLFEFPTLIQGFRLLNLTDIEPFTLVIWNYDELYEVRWDGESKYELKLNKDRCYIWSSSTLYSAQIREKRIHWFDEWCAKFPHPKQEDIMKFHEFTGDGDLYNDLNMNRGGELFTVSITSVNIGTEIGEMLYKDLEDLELFKSEIVFNPSKHSHA